MAEIRRGKLKGKKVTVLQFCNDWFSIEIDKQVKIVSPIALKFTEEEISRICHTANTGMLFDWYQLDREARTFSRYKLKRMAL